MALLLLSPAYILIPSVVMLFVTIMLHQSNQRSLVRFVVGNACFAGIKDSIYANLTVKDLRAACLRSFNYNLYDLVFWSIIRTCFQVNTVSKTLLS